MTGNGKIMSIVLVNHALVKHDLLKNITNVTRATIDKIVVQGAISFIYLIHHEGKTCPNCGGKIHDYGHGLCLACWIENKPSDVLGKR